MLMDIQDTQFQIHPDAMFTQMDDQMVILNYETGIYYALNKVGVRVWQLLEQKRTLREIVNQLLKEFKVSEEQLQHDLEKLIAKLKDKGLLL